MEKKDRKDTVSMRPDILDQYHRQKKTMSVGGGGGGGNTIYSTLILWVHKLKMPTFPVNLTTALVLFFMDPQLLWPDRLTYSCNLDTKLLNQINMALEVGRGGMCPWCPSASTTYEYCVAMNVLFLT